MPKTMIAMSGGVDSSAAARLIKDMGHDICGAIMTLYGDNSKDIKDAEAVAQRLGMPFYVFDFHNEFKKYVVDDFVSSYCSALTPNPCVVCNKHIKFGAFLDRARELGCDFVATGHYAKTEYDKERGRYIIKKADDLSKDQSYVLYSLTQDQLKSVILPLGSYTKDRSREIAKNSGFENAGRSDSQDICFIPNGEYASFIKEHCPNLSSNGNFVTKDGSVIAKHKGIINYTVGQRKGLGISAPAPYYVLSKDSESGDVILGSNDDLFSCYLTAKNVNFISIEALTEPMQVKVKIRYNQKEEADSLITPLANGRVEVEFAKPQRAITPGQSVVFYDGDVVVGGGVIE